MANEHQSKNETPAILSNAIEQPNAKAQNWPQPTAEEEAEHAWAWALCKEIDRIETEIERHNQARYRQLTSTDIRNEREELLLLNAELKRFKTKLEVPDWRATVTAEEPVPVALPTATEKQTKRATAFDDALPYLQEVYRNGKFKSTQEFIRKLTYLTNQTDSPFKKASIADTAFFLKEGGKSISHSSIADKMKHLR